MAQLRKLGAQMVDDKLVITVQGERKEFSVRVVDWTEGQEKAANVAANNPHIGGAFTEGLADILAEVQCDLGDLAFDELKLNELLEELPDNTPIAEDEVPEPPEEPITKPGDLWVLGDHRLICGDSTDADTVKRLLDGADPSLLMTDPPYGIGADSSMASQGGQKYGNAAAAKTIYPDTDWDSVPISGDAIDRFVDACDFACIWGGNYYDLHPSPSWLVWDKENGSNGFADAELAWTNAGGAVRLLRHMWNGMIRKDKESRVHPTQKPLGVIVWAIRQFEDATGVIFDPFLGSGTTLIAGEQLGRKVYGCELSPAYCDVIVQRWEALTGKEGKRG